MFRESCGVIHPVMQHFNYIQQPCLPISISSGLGCRDQNGARCRSTGSDDGAWHLPPMAVKRMLSGTPYPADEVQLPQLGHLAGSTTSELPSRCVCAVRTRGQETARGFSDVYCTALSKVQILRPLQLP